MGQLRAAKSKRCWDQLAADLGEPWKGSGEEDGESHKEDRGDDEDA